MRIKLADGRLPSNHLELLFPFLVRRLRLLWRKPSSNLEALSCAPQGIVPVVIVLANEEAAHLGCWTVEGGKYGDVPALSARSLHAIVRNDSSCVFIFLGGISFMGNFLIFLSSFSSYMCRMFYLCFTVYALMGNKRHERKVLRQNFPGKC